LSGAVSITSALAGIALVVAAGRRLQQLIYRSRRLAKRHERIERLWNVPGATLREPDLATHAGVPMFSPGTGVPQVTLVSHVR
jgi:hypothetical protein